MKYDAKHICVYIYMYMYTNLHVCEYTDYDVQCTFEACTIGRETRWTFTICNETDSLELLIRRSGIEAKVSMVGCHEQAT